MIELKSPGEIDAMREAGRVVAAMHHHLRALADVGVSLLDLDAAARDVLAEAGAAPSFLGYQPRFAPTPYPAVICTSVNDVILHGPPSGYRLRDGDLLSIDCGAVVDGWHADGAISIVIGQPRPEDVRLVEVAELALAAGIEAAQPGARLGDVGHAIATVGQAAGVGAQDDFGGHGIGRALHEAPFVANAGAPGRGLRLQPGLVVAIEPSFFAGTDDYVVGSDGWSLCAADGSRAAHVEHTVAITEDGPRVLTML